MTIRLLNEDGSFSRMLCRREANEMLESKEARRVYVRKTKQYVIRLNPKIEPSKSNPTPASITPAEMKANAGAAPIGAVRAARRKVREYGIVRFPLPIVPESFAAST